MRPVNKGLSPYVSINHYSEALPFLEEKIGLYCSYCGYPIPHVPEVEHVVAKGNGGNMTAWDNLLLGCKYCNTRKKAFVDLDNVNDYLWPDQYNTAIAYTYEYGIPAVNTSELLKMDSDGTALSKAQRLFDLLKLDNVPKYGSKDRRFRQRNKVFESAIDSLGEYRSGKEDFPEHIGGLIRQIIQTASYSGFFSVWMTVFKDEPEILNALIDAFPGTAKDFFDEVGLPRPVLTKPEELCAV